jgi:hypothetical protein
MNGKTAGESTAERRPFEPERPRVRWRAHQVPLRLGRTASDRRSRGKLAEGTGMRVPGG